MLKLFLTLLFPTILVGGLSFATTKLVSPERPGAAWVNWGGQSFSAPGELRSWLRTHGSSYQRWAANHPAAAARLEGRPPPREAAAEAPEKPSEAPRATDPSAAAERDTSAARGRASPSIASSVVLVGLVLLAVGMIAIAAVPVPVLFALNAPVVVHEHRTELAAAGAAIAVGMLAARLLSGA